MAAAVQRFSCGRQAKAWLMVYCRIGLTVGGRSPGNFMNRLWRVSASIESPTIRSEETLASWSSRLTCSVSLAMVSSLLIMSYLAAANSSRTTVFSTRSSCSDFSRFSILPHSCPMLAVRAARASMVEFTLAGDVLFFPPIC
jgi:hypothetical protein